MMWVFMDAPGFFAHLIGAVFWMVDIFAMVRYGVSAWRRTLEKDAEHKIYRLICMFVQVGLPVSVIASFLDWCVVLKLPKPESPLACLLLPSCLASRLRCYSSFRTPLQPPRVRRRPPVFSRRPRAGDPDLLQQQQTHHQHIRDGDSP
jgi:hypothetical protein